MPVVRDQHRVELDADDLGVAVGQHAEAQQQVLERLDVDRVVAAVAEQQRRSAYGTHQPGRVDVGQRQAAVADVAEQVGRHPGQAEGHQRTERRVVAEPDDGGDARGHRLHRHHAVAEHRDGLERGRDGGRVVQVELDAAHVGAVPQLRRRCS